MMQFSLPTKIRFLWEESNRLQDTLRAGGPGEEGGLLAFNMELACLQHGAEGEQA